MWIVLIVCILESGSEVTFMNKVMVPKVVVFSFGDWVWVKLSVALMTGELTVKFVILVVETLAALIDTLASVMSI